MMCRNPFVKDSSGRIFKASLLSGNLELAVGAIPFPCGQCLPCRINKRRVWTHRLMLESFCHDLSCFVTLTYDDEHISENHSLVKRDVQLFMKRLRKAFEPRKIRYYLAGEYGETTSRPHYHAILFGVGISDGEVIGNCWPHGHIMVGTCSRESIQYVAGYVTKKCVGKSDALGRLPEFSFMSRKPGLGAPALDNVVALMSNPQFQRYINIKGDVPDGLLHASKFMPFGRYLKDKLRKSLEVDYSPDSFIREIRDKFYVWKQENDKRNEKFVDFLVSESTPKAERQKARYKIFNRRNKL